MVNYEGGPDKSRFSWDPLTTLVAVRTIRGVPSVAACTDCDGINTIDPATGNNSAPLETADTRRPSHPCRHGARHAALARHVAQNAPAATPRRRSRTPSRRRARSARSANSCDPLVTDWVAGPPSNQTYLVLRNATAAGEALDQLLCQFPKRTLPEMEVEVA